MTAAGMDKGSNLADTIMKAIREAIITEKLVPGHVYSVAEVAERLGLKVSRTPVREALVRLADDGMVQFDRPRGVQVHKASLKDLEELFQLRLMLEVPAAYRAVRRSDDMVLYQLEGKLDDMRRAVKESERLRAASGIDDQLRQERLVRINLDFVEHDTAFHELVIAMGGNERLVRTVRTWRHLITATGAWRYIHQRGISAVMQEHEPVLMAIRDGDAERAALKMHEHLTKTGTQLLEALQRTLPEGSSFDPLWFEGVALPVVGEAIPRTSGQQ